jgi:hypothetical protein|eukprot:COSAG01_NODE_16935_length_1192_cov_3.392719_2_plen_178_part_00
MEARYPGGSTRCIRSLRRHPIPIPIPGHGGGGSHLTHGLAAELAAGAWQRRSLADGPGVRSGSVRKRPVLCGRVLHPYDSLRRRHRALVTDGAQAAHSIATQRVHGRVGVFGRTSTAAPWVKIAAAAVRYVRQARAHSPPTGASSPRVPQRPLPTRPAAASTEDGGSIRGWTGREFI